tara:strand:- start:257 stop:478 length:222 start_codon:yes stop_codon:yes gene_type:complete
MIIKSIIFNLLVIITINPIIIAHENHKHNIYNWPSSKNNTIESDSSFNVNKLDNKKIKTKTTNKNGWIKIIRR